MANFPGSVYAPSAVSNGQTIDASRDNGQDAEITAIEQGYLQGSAPLNSSNSTVANLSVTGGSSLATLNVSGLSTLTGAVTFGARPVLPPPEFALVYLESTKTIGSSAASTIAWTSDLFVSPSGMHSTASNPERLTPQTTGVYRCVVQVQTALFGSTGTFAIAIKDSTGDPIGGVQHEASSKVQFIQAEAFKRFDALGGYFVAVLGFSGQSTMSLSTGSTGTWAVLQKL